MPPRRTPRSSTAPPASRYAAGARRCWAWNRTAPRHATWPGAASWARTSRYGGCCAAPASVRTWSTRGSPVSWCRPRNWGRRAARPRTRSCGWSSWPSRLPTPPGRQGAFWPISRSPCTALRWARWGSRARRRSWAAGRAPVPPTARRSPRNCGTPPRAGSAPAGWARGRPTPYCCATSRGRRSRRACRSCCGTARRGRGRVRLPPSCGPSVGRALTWCCCPGPRTRARRRASRGSWPTSTWGWAGIPGPCSCWRPSARCSMSAARWGWPSFTSRRRGGSRRPWRRSPLLGSGRGSGPRPTRGALPRWWGPGTPAASSALAVGAGRAVPRAPCALGCLSRWSRGLLAVGAGRAVPRAPCAPGCLSRWSRDLLAVGAGRAVPRAPYATGCTLRVASRSSRRGWLLARFPAPLMRPLCVSRQPRTLSRGSAAAVAGEAPGSNSGRSRIARRTRRTAIQMRLAPNMWRSTRAAGRWVKYWT